jgi:hypothetical protein
MADRVDTLDVFNGKDLIGRRIFCLSDGTGESAVVKVQRSTLVNSNGIVPSKLAIEQLWWSINGFSSIELDWDHTTADEIAVLATGNGAQLYGRTLGVDLGSLWDPGSAGGTGNIILTSRGAVANASYNIYMLIRMSGQ